MLVYACVLTRIKNITNYTLLCVMSVCMRVNVHKDIKICN